jgi:hypothetical protein
MPMRDESTQVEPRGGSFPADPCFWQLEIAEDAERMREIFRAYLKPAAGRSFRVLDCRPFRFRCRQSTSRCVLQYTLRLADPDSGREWDQWVTGILYEEPGDAERQWRRLEADAKASDIPEPWRAIEPVCFIRDLEMVVEVFPFDRRLPQMSRVLDGAIEDLDSRLLARLGPGEWLAGTASFEPSRYRTEMGAVFRYALEARDVASKRREHVRCYVKVYRNERGAETFERLRTWMREPPRPYGLVQPIGYWPPFRTLVLEEAPGTPLTELLKAGGDHSPAVQAAALATAAFNQDDLGNLPPHDHQDHLDQLERAADLVRWACPEVRHGVHEVVSAVVQGVRPVAPRPIHGDLKPDHVFLDGDRVVFVDLDSVMSGDPVRDPAHFCSYVLGRVGLEAIPTDRVRSFAREFADTYFSHVPRDWRDRFPLYCAGALVEVAAGIFRHQRPRWRERATMAVLEALHVLSGGLR